MYTNLFSVNNKNNTPPRCSEDQDNLRSELITLVLRYPPHSGDKALTRVTWVPRKPTWCF